MSKISWWKAMSFPCLFCAATVIAFLAQTFETLVSFSGTDSATPYAGLVQSTDGNVYRITPSGGPMVTVGSSRSRHRVTLPCFTAFALASS